MIKITPPLTKETAKAKVQAAEDAWNSKDPEKIAMAYTIDSQWRNRDLFFTGREAIVHFLKGKWKEEQYYKLKKYLWSFSDNRISVRFEYEWQDEGKQQWYKTNGNEHRKFDTEGKMRIRDMSANDIKISKSEKKL